MSIPYITFEDMDGHLAWSDITDAIETGHKLPKASITDGFAYRNDDTLLSRAAWIDGLGAAVKSATVIPSNKANNRPMIHGGVMVFDDETGDLEAVLDFHLVTKWKTAGDSLAGARWLARPDSKHILIMGAGTVGRNLVYAYSTLFPDVKFTVWNRSRQNAELMVAELQDHHEITLTDDLEAAVRSADIICGATMSTDPILKGAWLQEGQHVDLIGAYRPDMREVDTEALQRSQIFVDSRETTVGHIGELKIPLEAGDISLSDIRGDFYDMDRIGRRADQDITLFKNGGGAHLDLMTAKVILKKWRAL